MRRRILFGTLVLLAVAGAWAAMRFRRGAALRAYTAELRAKGERLTVAELTANYSTSPAGWAVQLSNQVAALGPTPANPEKLRLAEFVAPNRARVTWSLPQPPWDPLDARQTNVAWSELSRRVSSSGPALQQLQKFLGRPAANGGRPTNWFDFHPVWHEMKSAAGWLACSTLVSLREGRHDDALAGVQAIAGLAGMYREECALAHQMARVAVANLGLDLTWEVLEAEGWSEEQLSAFQRCWEEHDFLAAAELGLLGERALPLESLDLIHERQKQTRGSASGLSPFTKPTWPIPFLYQTVVFPNDALYGLRHLQRQVELVRQLAKGAPYREVIVAFAANEAVIEAKGKSVTRFLYPITLVSLPAYEKAVARCAQVEAKRRLAITAVALRRFQLSRGRWPQELAELSPGFLRRVPLDCMEGQPLKYRRNADGTFTLYSVGVDGLDNGGDPKPRKPGMTGLGEGLDAVWPIATGSTQNASRRGRSL
jgi:hypothetical protein